MKPKSLVTVGILLLVAMSFMSVFPAKALGGGFIQSGRANNNGGSTSCVITLTNVIKNDYLLFISYHIVGPNSNSPITVSSITDSNGDIFTLGARNTIAMQLNIYAAKFSGITGSVTVTITFSASTTNKCILEEVSGLTSTTIDSSSFDSGNVNTNSVTTDVTSFNPTINTYCIGAIGIIETGTITAITDSVANPFVFDTSVGTLGNLQQLRTLFRTQMDGTAQTAQDTITATGATSIIWNEVAACYSGGPATTTVTNNVGEPNFQWMWLIPLGLIVMIPIAARRRR